MDNRAEDSCYVCFWAGMSPDRIREETKKLAKDGAVAALQEIGFYDEQGRVDKKAVSDFMALRNILRDWVEVKQTTRRAVLKWLLYIALGALTIRLGLTDLLRLGKE